MENKQLSESRKKAIAYKIINKDIKNLCSSTLAQFRLFKSADIIHFSNISGGASVYALVDFDKMVNAYEKENNTTVVKYNIAQEFKPHQKPEFVYFYNKSVIKKVLDYFGEDYVKFNKEYCTIYDYARYSLAKNNIKFIRKDEEKVIKSEAIKHRKRIENEKNNVRKIESGIVKRHTCYLYNVEDLELIDSYYRNTKTA